jgi:tRNA A-37 threonylcarbamoyl transferase component Bud32
MNTSIAVSSPVTAMKHALSDHFSGVNIRLGDLFSVRENSNIFHSRIAGPEPFDAAVKQCLVPQTKILDPISAKKQYNALERVHRAFEGLDDRYSVPIPLHFSPSFAAFAMSWVNGESLSAKLRSPLAIIEGPSWMRSVGAWLAHFHTAGPRRSLCVGSDLRLLDAGNYPVETLQERAFANATRVLEQAAPLLKGLQVEMTWLHGDCKADNFILKEDAVCGIDISLCDENPVEYDIAMFLNNLGMLLSGPQYIHVRALQSRFEDAFWEGYRLFGPPVSQAYLDWTRLNFLLYQWNGLYSARRPRLNTWVLNRIYATLTTHLHRKVDRSLRSWH